MEGFNNAMNFMYLLGSAIVKQFKINQMFYRMSMNSPGHVVVYTHELEKMEKIKEAQREVDTLWHGIMEHFNFSKSVDYHAFISHVHFVNQFGSKGTFFGTRDKYDDMITPEISELVEQYIEKKRILQDLKGSTRCDAFTDTEYPPRTLV